MAKPTLRRLLKGWAMHQKYVEWLRGGRLDPLEKYEPILRSSSQKVLYLHLDAVERAFSSETCAATKGFFSRQKQPHKISAAS